MNRIVFSEGPLADADQRAVAAGFDRVSAQSQAPPYARQQYNWTIREEQGALIAVLTADILWDWMYIDELWTDESLRGRGYGTQLMREAEAYASTHKLAGIWLWTQSWQAVPFYAQLGYEEFARFPDFPRGHFRVGFRKTCSSSG